MPAFEEDKNHKQNEGDFANSIVEKQRRHFEDEAADGNDKKEINGSSSFKQKWQSKWSLQRSYNTEMKPALSQESQKAVVSPKILQHSNEASSSIRVTEVMVLPLSFTSIDNEAYEAPAYEEVVTTGYLSGPTIWTITSSPGTTPVEPPPYSVVIEPSAHGETVVEAFSVSVAPGTRRASEADLQSRFRLRLLMPPKLQRFVSDTHELKGVEEPAERPEPLTPPPAYENATVEEVLEEEFQPSRL
ncbi:uncharacterized protein LOC128405338 [Podarcis raffonei]|uniref:uncharacterized protein LOC128405338 n=1 Tax=Podarcis raffonei TaxID=65483 RepID=UPI002329675A|nr:uncharacterized protein LOC128405338 [Podarcis raffonei]